MKYSRMKGEVTAGDRTIHYTRTPLPYSTSFERLKLRKFIENLDKNEVHSLYLELSSAIKGKTG